jgi:hypothetical protein
MAYSDTSIANMALQRIGAKGTVTSLTDGSTNAVRINNVWQYIRDEVLEAVKPKFATVRVALSQSSTSPANEDVYAYAYPLPSDFICLAENIKDDPVVWPSPDVEPYCIETLADGTVCLMTNYDIVTGEDIYLTYVKRVTDPAKYSPPFINCLCFRLAAELSFIIPESGGKFDAMMKQYMISVRKAQGMSRSLDYLAEERGSTDWEYAGR